MRPVQFFADTIDGGRAKLGVTFDDVPDDHVINELMNNLGAECLIQNHGKTYKFFCPNNHVNPVKFTLAKMAIHRAGYQRFDELFMDQENADECFGCREPGNANHL